PIGGASFAFCTPEECDRPPQAVREEEPMAIYVSLIKWTDQGRSKVDSLPDRVAQVDKRVEEAGGKVVANYVTMGRFDQIAITEAPDDETAAKLLLIVAGRG